MRQQHKEIEKNNVCTNPDNTCFVQSRYLQFPICIYYENFSVLNGEIVKSYERDTNTSPDTAGQNMK